MNSFYEIFHSQKCVRLTCIGDHNLQVLATASFPTHCMQYLNLHATEPPILLNLVVTEIPILLSQVVQCP